MRREKGSFASVLMPCFSSFSRRWISKDCAPTLSLSRVPKELPAGMAILSFPLSGQLYIITENEKRRGRRERMARIEVREQDGSQDGKAAGLRRPACSRQA